MNNTPSPSPLHSGLWARLTALCARGGAVGPSEIVLRGSYGAGKSELLRQYYGELFENQDAQTPLLIRIPPVPFQPLNWARRFTLDVVMQWLAFDRRDPDMISASVPSVARLVEYCRERRLHALADLLETPLPENPAEGTLVVEAVFDALDRAAYRMERRVCLLIDSPENAVWNGPEGECFLTRCAPPLPENAWVRRIWALRAETSDVHPFLIPSPPGAEPWDVSPLAESVALDFFDKLAQANRLEYDRYVVADYLPLWGASPRLIANFVKLASEQPQALDSPNAILQIYIKDASEGPTARGLQDALRLAFPTTPPDPERIARAASLHLNPVDSRPDFLSRSARPSAEDDASLARIARAGLAIYTQGHWEMTQTPALADFLKLYTARHQRGESLVRAEIALKRERLVEAPKRLHAQLVQDRSQQLLLLMQTFREQHVPAALLHAHQINPPFEAPLPQTAVAGSSVRMPCCIGSFAYAPPALPTRQATASPMPVLIGWCFDSAQCCRSEEMIWAAFLCEAATVTTEELNDVERLCRQLTREFNVGKVTGWLIADGAFSDEAAARANAMQLYVSNWAACETLAETLMGSFRGQSESAEKKRTATDARIVNAPQAATEKVVELLLPPEEDIELVAASALERLADSLGFAPDAITQMKMALQEACLNAVERSANPEKRIRVRFEGTPQKFGIVVENEGASFDPQRVATPVLEEKLHDSYKRGWGMHLMKKFMDRVVYEPYEQGVRVRMEKQNAPVVSESDNVKKAAQ
ncbi:TPA: hypothetical protein DDW35_05895 [Candidatus Sumerlaeota bacterium]|jgi:serine/threonine-protein kinase RsbW|nr:hypothetical protein [Candidatus Sumerlaeota bacterium]